MLHKLFTGNRKVRLIIGLVTLIVFSLSACSNTSTGTPTGTAPSVTQTSSGNQSSGSSDQTIDVTEQDFNITLSTSVVSPGKVTFNLTNNGPSEHEFIIIKTDLAPDSLPTSQGIVDMTSSDLTKIAEQDKFPSSDTPTLSANLDKGNYVVICNLPGHYQQGMHAALVVTDNAGPTQTALAQSSSQATPTAQATETQQSSSTGQVTAKVQVIEKNYEIFIDKLSVPAGTIEFDLRNEGVSEHELVIFKTDLAPDSLPVENGQVNETASGLEKVAEQDQYPMGETRTLTVDLTPGKYVLICNLPSHYQQGMYIAFTVTEAQGGSQSESPTAKVHVVLQSYAILMNKASVPAGQVEFDIENIADMEHEFVVFKTDLAGDSLPVSQGQVDENSSQLTKIDEQDKFPGGETRTLTLNLDPGHYVMICNLPGHYQQGMYFDFMVTEAQQGNAATSIQVALESYMILLSKGSVVAGPVEFTIHNLADVEHEFVIFKTDLAGDNLPVNQGQVDENSSQLTKIDEQDKFPGGETRTLTVNLDPGHYVLICNLPGHYQQGMYFELTVTTAQSSSQADNAASATPTPSPAP